MTTLTHKQQEVLDYIRGHMSSFGVTPTTRQIQKHFGFASQTAAAGHLNCLAKKGYVWRTGHRYGLVEPWVQWSDVKLLVESLRYAFPHSTHSFYAKYPHLKP